MKFAELVSNVIGLNVLTSDECAQVLTWFLEYRNEIKQDFDTAKEEVTYLNRVLEDARSYSKNLHSLAVARACAIETLERENEALKAALAEARAKVEKVVRVNMRALYNTNNRWENCPINFIKEVRKEKECISISDKSDPGLRFCKEVCLVIISYTGGMETTFQNPTHRGKEITRFCKSSAIQEEIEWLCNEYFPGYTVEFVN